MSSHARSSREERRRLSIRTLIIASVGSASAAILTSQFWIAGTPIAAALTPVIVALVSEMLHRPTERIAQRFTTETRALPETDALPDAAGAGPPPRTQERAPRPAREAPEAGPGPGMAGPPSPRGGRPPGPGREPGFRVHRGGRPSASSLPWQAIIATAAIAFAIAAAMLTLPELIAGQSLGGGDRTTTLWGGGTGDDDGGQIPDTERTEPRQDEETVPAAPEPDEPGDTAPAPQPPPDETTTPTTPSTTTEPARPRSSSPAPPEGQEP